jgi:transposase
MSHGTNRKHEEIKALLLNPVSGLSQEQIAKIVGVSRRTVIRVKKEMESDLSGLQDKLAEYQMHIGKRLPIEDRVRRYKELIEQEEQKMVSLKALERIDSLDGVVTPRESRGVPEDERPHQPLFYFPPGSRPVINMRLPNKPESEQTDIPAAAEEVED